MNILLTGGTGYIGSHNAVVLAQAGHEAILFDNLCNSSKDVVQRLEKIIGKPITFIEGDVRNTELLVEVMRNHQVDAVIHFAGLKAVGESVANPLLYFANNVQGTISLLLAMQQLEIKTFIFSSSATVYGEPVYLPYDEAHPTNPINAYGDTKLQVEIILRDLAKSDPQWKIACLRYFNPVGAHESGFIGDDPSGIPGNLMPYLARVASGSLQYLSVFGKDYETRDGTGERDYIHVMDLAEGHMAALDFLANNSGLHVVNLGTGKPASVLECVKAFEGAVGKNLPIQFAPRRDGDLPIYFAKADLAKEKLGWIAARTLDEMCASAWHFQQVQSSQSKSSTEST
ncbi:UDP-glucose 4-epimerase GalE [Polynucleobacter tropicus]|uniref:UDP-glucose 4-epimerase n=1 Tax=Polynucleobacter tropicus TaxID=1743174 RepID=A0A6M9PTQ5_9BURK|nr:UDP-glucose 4-epimerase GalE [Polynucleobacter tropicus]QKM64029.1 UDP-glucose 4-epimerase GalE [Polynucleobacter tropicus]